jgi:hypothetical protein
LLGMRARNYDTTTGRFITSDPIAGAIPASNHYAYAGNNPISNTDPTGLWTFSIGFGGTGGAAGGGGTAVGSLVWDGRSLLPGVQITLGAGGYAVLGGSLGLSLTGTNAADSDSLTGFGGEVGGSVGEGLGVGGDYVFPLGNGYQGVSLNGGISAGMLPFELHGFGTYTWQPIPPGWFLPNACAASPGSCSPGGGGGSGTSASVDPNEKTGPAGFGPNHFVAAEGFMPYRIDFENDKKATAPAQNVLVTDQLSSFLDWDTVELIEVGFGDILIQIPAGSRHFQAAVPMSYNEESFEAQMEIGLDAKTGLLTARFYSIDPNTSLPPSVLAGFLPPENGTGRGQGHINYVVRPKTGLATGVQIRNVAYITFDGSGETIATNQVDPHDPAKGTDPTKEALITIDAGVPSSAILPLAPTVITPTFTVSWAGQDDIGGSGVGTYDVYVSADGGLFMLWLHDTQLSQSSYAGAVGHSYAFYSVATDNAGNAELGLPVADAQTFVTTAPFVVTGTSGQDAIVVTEDTNTLTVTINGSPTSAQLSQISSLKIDSGGGGADTLSFAGPPAGGLSTVELVGTFTITADASGWGLVAGGNTIISFNASQHLSALSLTGNAVAQMIGNGDHFLRTANLSITGPASFDLGDNDLIIGGHATNASAMLDAITALVKSGRGTGNWNGPGITSSKAAADLRKITGLAITLNDRGNGAALYGKFDGEEADASDVLVKYTYNGDMDLNGKVDADDYFLIDRGYSSGSHGYENGDLDFNGTIGQVGIDADDYFLIDSAFASQNGVLSQAPSGTSIFAESKPNLKQRADSRRASRARRDHHHRRQSRS